MTPTSTETRFRSYEEACASHRWEVPPRYNIAANVCDKHPRDKLAMIWEDHRGAQRRVTWGELQSLAARAANVLRAHGIERGDRVAVVAPATPETAAVFFGTWKLGAILLAMSVLYGDEGIRHRVADSQAKLIVCSADQAARMPGDLVEEVLVLDEELLAGQTTMPRPSTPPPTIRPSSTTRPARPGSRRGSCTPTATSSATKSSSTATTSGTASSSTAWANGPGPRESRRSWGRGGWARRSSCTREREASTRRSSSTCSRATPSPTCSRRPRRCGR